MKIAILTTQHDSLSHTIVLDAVRLDNDEKLMQLRRRCATDKDFITELFQMRILQYCQRFPSYITARWHGMIIHKTATVLETWMRYDIVRRAHDIVNYYLPVEGDEPKFIQIGVLTKQMDDIYRNGDSKLCTVCDVAIRMHQDRRMPYTFEDVFQSSMQAPMYDPSMFMKPTWRSTLIDTDQPMTLRATPGFERRSR